MKASHPNGVLITGASSGIGAALARAYAAPGVVLHLGGRDRQRLEAVAAECAAAGARAEPQVVDVRDREATAAWIQAADSDRPLDLVIANAGISGGTGGGGEGAEQTRRIFAVNVDGVLNTILPAIERMRGRESGQIALMSSLAGFRGMPGAPAYAASKAAVRSLGEGLRGALAADGIRVSVICPGFVKSPMTDANDFPMPLLMDADTAARRIKEGLARNRAHIVFPRRLFLGAWLLSAMPASWADALTRRLPRKPAQR